MIGTSAKSGDGVDVIFEEILKQLQTSKVPGVPEKRDRSETIKLKKQNVNTDAGPAGSTGSGGKNEGGGKKKKGGCCGG